MSIEVISHPLEIVIIIANNNSNNNKEKFSDKIRTLWLHKYQSEL